MKKNMTYLKGMMSHTEATIMKLRPSHKSSGRRIINGFVLDKLSKEMKGKIGVIVEAMKRKISTAVDDLVHNKDLPFSPDVMRYHLSPKLKKCLKVVPNDII